MGKTSQDAGLQILMRIAHDPNQAIKDRMRAIRGLHTLGRYDDVAEILLSIVRTDPDIQNALEATWVLWSLNYRDLAKRAYHAIAQDPETPEDARRVALVGATAIQKGQDAPWSTSELEEIAAGREPIGPPAPVRPPPSPL